MVPIAVQNDQLAGTLEIAWEDGTQSIRHGMLRSLCRCAVCRASNIAAARPASDDIRVIDIQPIGLYGVQLSFSDGHERGIFPWTYLKSIPL